LVQVALKVLMMLVPLEGQMVGSERWWLEPLSSTLATLG